MTTHSKDFSSLEYDISDLKQGTDLLIHFPKLAELKSFVSNRDKNKNRIIRYIILMYSKETPMRDYYPDLEKRKKESALLSGFPLNTSETKFKDDLTYLFEFKGEKGAQFLSMVAEFLALQKDRLISKIASTETAFWEYQKLIFDPIKNGNDDKDKDVLSAATTKTKLIEDSNKLDDLLQKYYSELSNGNDEVVEEVRKKNMGFSPEAIASNNA